MGQSRLGRIRILVRYFSLRAYSSAYEFSFTTGVRFGQLSNAAKPIDVTLSDNFISVRPEYAANAKSYEKGMTMRRISDTPEDIFAFHCDGTWLTYETFSDTKKIVVIILHI